VTQLIAMFGYYIIIAILSLLVVFFGFENNIIIWLYIAIVLFSLATFVTQIRLFFPYLDNYCRRVNLVYATSVAVVMLLVKRDELTIALILAISSFTAALFFARSMQELR
jgi:hypothetical protein